MKCGLEQMVVVFFECQRRRLNVSPLMEPRVDCALIMFTPSSRIVKASSGLVLTVAFVVSIRTLPGLNQSVITVTATSCGLYFKPAQVRHWQVRTAVSLFMTKQTRYGSRLSNSGATSFTRLPKISNNGYLLPLPAVSM